MLPPKVKEIILAKRRRAKRFARNQHPYRLGRLCMCVCVTERGEREVGGPTNCQTESESELSSSNDRQDRMTFWGLLSALIVLCIFVRLCVCVEENFKYTHTRRVSRSRVYIQLKQHPNRMHSGRQT